MLMPFVLALPTAGCGGGSSTAAPAQGSSTAATSAATGAQAQFITQADSVCRRINSEIAAIKAKSTSAAEVIRVVPRTLAIEQGGAAALERLTAPGSLASAWQRMLAYRRELARELEQLLEDAKQNDGTSVKPLGAAKRRAHVGLSKTARANGFNDCAKIGNVG
jgi:hypothetical protein